MSVFAYFLGGLFTSLLVNILLLRFSQSLGIRNKNDITIRWSNQSKPSLGGISFYIVFLFAGIVFPIFDYVNNIFHNPLFVVLFIAGALAFAMGLADDAYNTKPLVKLAVQITCGLLLAYGGCVMNITNYEWVNYSATVFWVVLLMNSLNMLDNMDGITGTVCLFILIVCQSSLIIQQGFEKSIWLALNFAVIGGLVGFLKHNINPSKLFMGDAGSQFIGLYVAFMSIHCIFNVGQVSPISGFNWQGLSLILITFSAPFADTLTVVINRIMEGRSPMVGGKDHTTHHLVYKGWTDKQVWLIFLSIAIASSVLTILLIAFGQRLHPLAWGVSLALPVIVFLRLYFITRKYPQVAQ